MMPSLCKNRRGVIGCWSLNRLPLLLDNSLWQRSVMFLVVVGAVWCVVVWFVVVKRRRQSIMATQRHVFGGSWCVVVCCGVVCLL